MTAYGRTYSREKWCDVFSAKANSCGVTGGARGFRSAAWHGIADKNRGLNEASVPSSLPLPGKL